jgi:hypothetical protein
MRNLGDGYTEGDYQYFAWLRDKHVELADAMGIFRTWRGSKDVYKPDERYTPDSGWVDTLWMYEVRTERKRGWLKWITNEEAEQFKEILAARGES